jgi:acetyl esterase/lipase
MKHLAHFLLAAVFACSLVLTATAAEPHSTHAPLSVELWPDGTPTAMQPKSEATEKLFQSYGCQQPNRITDVMKPTIRVYPSGKPDSPAVIVVPGGGFMFLSWEHEGTQVCEWLNTLGITAVLLEYRTPTRDEPEMFTLPVEDAQRAMGLCRHRAREWGIDPKRVGILGFSAGANLAGHAAWDRGARTYPQDPKLDDPRGPDFLVFVYGGGILDKDDPPSYPSKASSVSLSPTSDDRLDALCTQGILSGLTVVSTIREEDVRVAARPTSLPGDAREVGDC